MSPTRQVNAELRWPLQGAALLGEAAAAMQMGARERANYLRHLVAGRQAGEADILEEDEATLAGSNVAALRSWVRTVSALRLPFCALHASAKEALHS